MRAARLNTAETTSKGYLQVYSATDLFNNGDSSYFPHSSYVIYSKDGKVFETIENHVTRDDEIPSRISLPIGAYLLEARSEEEGYIRIPVLIKEGEQTTLHLDLRRVR